MVNFAKDADLSGLARQIREAVEWVKNLGSVMVAYAVAARLAAVVKGQLGFAKDVAEINEQVRKWTTLTDGDVERRIALTRTAWQNVLDQLANRWTAFKEKLLTDNRGHLAEYLKAEQDAARQRVGFETQVYERKLQYNEEIARRNLDHLERMMGVEEQRLGLDRDARLRAAEAMDAQTLDQKAALEQRKAAASSSGAQAAWRWIASARARRRLPGASW